MGNFYKRLSYSFGNEDWTTEKRALQLKENDRALVVSASGDRPLNLLMSSCKQIVAIDANPFQTALLDLKKAAMTLLSYEEYLAFLGIKPCSNRLKTLKKLEKNLGKESLHCWTQHSKKVEKGVIYQGAMEKSCKKIAFFAQSWQGEKLQTLFSFDSLENQRAFLQKNWSLQTWKKIFNLVINPFLMRLLIKDPGLYTAVDPNISAPTYIFDRMEKSLQKFLAKENIIASLFFQGWVSEQGFSPYLTEEGYHTIRPRLDALEHQTADVISYLEAAPDCSFDAFSLSDIASYMQEKDFHRMCLAMHRTARPNARFCIREFMSGHKFPKEVESAFLHEPTLEKTLEEEDRCFLYRFHVGTIRK